MKGIVYILQSVKNGRYYIGSTANLEKRLQEHNSGKTKSIKYLIPFRIMYQQSFDNIDQARSMELKLKRLKSKLIIDRIIADQEIKLGS